VSHELSPAVRLSQQARLQLSPVTRASGAGALSILLSAVALLAAAVVLAGCGEDAPAPTTTTDVAVRVPDVRGELFAPPALRKLCAAGLTIRRVTVTRRTGRVATLEQAFAEAHVVTTLPRAGTPVAPGSAVSLQLSAAQNVPRRIPTACDFRDGPAGAG
jgi:hypothetical protein